MFAKHGSTDPGLFVPEPEPGQSFVVKSLEILSRGRRTDTIRMGDDLSLLVTLDPEAQPSHRSVAMGFGIENSSGLRVEPLVSWMAKFSLMPLVGLGFGVETINGQVCTLGSFSGGPKSR